MTIMLATLCLNEMEHLSNLYEQHKDWPDLKEWVFVEAADRVFQLVAPELVSNDGLSTDGTTDFLRELAKKDDRVKYIPFGFTSHQEPDQGKVTARNQYLKRANEIKPTFVFVLDADEYYPKEDQKWIEPCMRASFQANGFVFRQRHIWRPPSIASEPLFAQEVIGGYWRVIHHRGWRYLPGMRYRTNHNFPESTFGTMMQEGAKRFDRDWSAPSPQCIHLGYASNGRLRKAKHEYYVARGEGRTDHRQRYVDCRTAWENWKPGDSLPQGASVIRYDGPIPEVFQ
jgi:glycosyltransferase involved in cell wall biosynthesis